jgi:SWI/SNF-related matrix-associated actin-dependent regulator 1 of chromatin subfamily A
MKAHFYTISGGFASRENMPVVFRAAQLAETAKAVYLYGHADPQKAKAYGKCCRCGRQLTHPGSILLGIGPECLGNWDLRDIALNGLSAADIEALTTRIAAARRVDSWFPKAVIVDQEDAPDLEVPADHPKLKKPDTAAGVVAVGDKFEVRFPYDPAKVSAMRIVPGRRWDAGRKLWILPQSAEAVKALESIGMTAPKVLKEEKPKPKRAAIDLTGFGRQLMPFQRQGLEFLVEKEGRALIGDEMGLGKTIQALAYIHANPDKLPALVICPASLKLNWDREAAVACPNLRRYIISGKKSERLPPADIYIINYDIMAVRLGDLMSAGIQTMILDECHYLKNRSAQRTKAVLGSGTKHPGMSSVPYIIALSGTPILNRPAEVYPVIKTLAPKQIPAWMTFAYRYCGARHNGFGWDFTGSSNTEELHQLLTSTVMIRRLKSDVLKDLPAKQRSALPMEMSSEVVKDYAAARSNFITWLKSVDPSKVSAAQRAETLVQFQALKRLAARGKWKAATDWLKDSLESNGKIIVFAVHHEAIDKLMEDLKDFRPVKVDGRDSQEARQAAVDRFQNDETCRLFVGNIKAAGVGLTLTEASAVVFLELGWTPGEHVQAEDRPHRIGQTKSVNVYYLVAADTVEEEIAALLDKKQKVLDAVLDGFETDQDSLLSELLKRYMEQAQA